MISPGSTVRVTDKNTSTYGQVGIVVSRPTSGIYRVQLPRWPIGGNINFVARQLEVVSPPPSPPPPGGTAGASHVPPVIHRLTSAEVSARQFSLPLSPSDPTRVLITIRGIGPQFPELDFRVSGNVVSWADNSLGMRNLQLRDGDIAAILY